MQLIVPLLNQKNKDTILCFLLTIFLQVSCPASISSRLLTLVSAVCFNNEMSTNLKQVKIYRNHPSSKKPILVVDDEFDIVNTIRLWLDRHSFEVCGFTDPLLALEHFKDNYNKIDLVLSDIRMPQMNGYELANSLKALQPKVKIILMSAFEIREV